MRIYFKNGGKSYNLNYKEKRIVEKLQPIIDAKIAENPELAEKFVPARNFEELEKMYNDYASEEVTIESETINQDNMTEEEELDDDFQESIQRMREIAGIEETPSMFFPDPRDTANQLGISTTRLIDTPTPMSTSNNRSYNNTFLDPAQKAQNRLARQNESIFTDTANLWKSYKG